MNQSIQTRLTPAALMVTLLLLPVFMVQGVMDSWNVDGEHGGQHVHGTLTESACWLDMTSMYQAVWLGDIGTGILEYEGGQGTPVSVQLNLRDCVRRPGHSQEIRSCSVSWNASQHVVSVSFMAPADFDNPDFVKVTGAKGLGVRVLDALHREIQLRTKGEMC